MRTHVCAVVVAVTYSLALEAGAESTISAGDHRAFAANAGWIDCRADGTNGMVAGEFFCSGYVYGANIGWIHLGDGSPAGGYAYANGSASDYGVNHDGSGNLRGYAYGANVGWIRFAESGAPSIDLWTGSLSGYAFGANIGWISLSNLYAHVLTDRLDAGPDTDHDGLPDPWEYSHTNSLTALGPWDSDLDGASDAEEYSADTDPFDVSNNLRVTALGRAGEDDIVTWKSEQTRLYLLSASGALPSATSWQDSGLGLQTPDVGVETTRSVTEPAGAQQFYRVKAVRPLTR